MRPALALGIGDEAGFTGDDQRRCRITPMFPARPVRGILTPFESRIVADVIRRLPMRNLPDNLAFVHIDRRNGSVGGLNRGSPCTVSAPLAAAAPSAAGGGATSNAATPRRKFISERPPLGGHQTEAG